MYHSELKEPVEPAYLTKYPSQKISLYEGEVQCFYEENGTPHEFSGVAVIEYTWHPSIRATFTIEYRTPIYLINLVFIKLQIKDCDNIITGEIYDRQEEPCNPGGFIGHISGNLVDKTFTGNDDNLHHIIFHIVNFTTFSGVLRKTCEETGQHTHRVTFVEGDWEIIVDQLMSSAQSFKDLKKDGGYSITHVGRIQRKDNASFSRNDASKIINVFSIFLSFLKGSKVSTILLVGYDKQNNKICEEWESNLSGHPYQNRISWMPNNMLVDLPTIFPNFVSWWNKWGQAATLILNLYLEANYNNLMDVSIVFSCSTLEMLARVILVEERQIITESKFDNSRENPTAKRIASLLNEFLIPVDFPPSSDDSIDNLIRFATDNKDKLDVDGKSTPKALLVFTKIRNEMTHSNKKYQDKLSPEILFEVASLGLWYVEMTILARLDYKGVYRNRLNRNRWDERSRRYDYVPWYKPEE